MRKMRWDALLWRDESGQAFIELSLALCVFMVMVLGAFEMAQLSFASIEVTNSARAAAQYASTNGGHFLSGTTSGLDETGMLRAAKADAGTLGSSLTFTSGYPTVSCTCSGSGTATCTGASFPPPTGCSPPSSVVLITVTVKTQASYTPPIFGSLMIWGKGQGATKSAITLYGYASQQVIGY